jgi:hypothetical protein
MGRIDPHDATHGDDSALPRMCAFLQCVGLPKDHAEALATRAARTDVTPSAKGSGEDEFSDDPLALIMSDYENWLRDLRQTAGPRSHPYPGLLAAHLRPVLNQNPEIYLQSEGLPPAARQAIEKAGQPPVPGEARSVMPTQRLSDLPAVFHLSLWTRLAGELRLAKRSLLRLVHRVGWLP